MSATPYIPMKLSFLPGPAMKLAQLDEGLAQRVLDTISRGIAKFDRHEHFQSVSGFDVEIGFTRLNEFGLDLGVCSLNEDLTIVALDRVLAWEKLLQNADLASMGSGLIGPVALDRVSAVQVLRMLRAYSEQANLVSRSLFISYSSSQPSSQSQESYRLAHKVLLHRQYRRWKSTQARQEFRDLLDRAITEPQIVERDGEDVIVIGRDLLDAYEEPKSAAELADYFSARAKETPLQPFTAKRPVHLPRARFTLPDLQ